MTSVQKKSRLRHGNSPSVGWREEFAHLEPVDPTAFVAPGPITGLSWMEHGASPSQGLLHYTPSVWDHAVGLSGELDTLHLTGGPEAGTLLAAVPSNPSLEGRAPAQGHDEEPTRKRHREDENRELNEASLETFLASLGNEEVGRSGLGDGPGEDFGKEGSLHSGGDGDRKKLDKVDAAVAAKNKAQRERMRRERLNDSFVELAQAIEPGKTAKTDKTSIISDAIKLVTQLRAENGQLKQLNKFLEEKVQTTEKARMDAECQLRMQNSQMNHSGMMPGNRGMCMGGMAVGQPVNMMMSSLVVPPDLPPGTSGKHQLSQQEIMGYGQQMSGHTAMGMVYAMPQQAHTYDAGGASAMTGVVPGLPVGGGSNAGMGMSGGGGPSSFLPASALDTSKDGVRRPPAA